MIAEHFNFFICQPYSMDCKEVFVKHAQIIQMGNCCRTACCFDIFNFIFNLRHMHMHTNIVFICQFLCANDQIICIIKNGTKTKPYFHTPIACVVEFLEIFFLFIQFFICCFLPYFRKTFTAVHGRFCKFGTKTSLCNTAGHTSYMLSAWFCEGCTSTFDLFKTAGQCGNVRIFFRHIAFIWPDTIMQPCQEIYIISQASAKLLRCMDMSVDQSRHNDLAFTIDHFIHIFIQIKISDFTDLIINYEDTALGVYFFFVIHCNNKCIFQ